jgi:antitoxin (DNA-binding transcriptional repressor) of toxin-antitoxin stability system
MGRAWSTPERSWDRADYMTAVPSGEVGEDVPVRPLRRVPRGTGLHRPLSAPRVELRDVVLELAEYIDTVHTDQVTFTITTSYGNHALAYLAPADEQAPGQRVNLSAIKRTFGKLVTAASEGESAVICVRRRTVARLEPLAWTGDEPEPVRNPALWNQVCAEIDRRLQQPRLTRGLAPASRAAARDVAAKLAYDVVAAHQRYGFELRDIEFDPFDHAVWAVLHRVR